MKATELVSFFSQKRVLVLGDVMMDEYIHGDVHRISPEAPVPVLDIRERVFRAGGAANAASNVTALGGVAVLIGVVGADDAATILKANLSASHVSHSLVVASDCPTTTKTRVVARGQQVVRLDHESRRPLGLEAEERLLSAMTEQMAQADACILSDYAKAVVSERIAKATIREARRVNCPVVVDPKGRSFAKYCGATIVTPNTDELSLATGRTLHTDADVDSAATALLATLEDALLLVTRGPLGMTLFVPGRPPVRLRTMAREVFDVVGAGDTVVATLALGLAARASPEMAVDLANRAAGIVVGKPGTATISQSELISALNSDG